MSQEPAKHLGIDRDESLNLSDAEVEMVLKKVSEAVIQVLDNPKVEFVFGMLRNSTQAAGTVHATYGGGMAAIETLMASLLEAAPDDSVRLRLLATMDRIVVEKGQAIVKKMLGV